MDALPDPCPLPGAGKRRGLNERERLLYAPMADVGGLLYDKDAVYIDIPDWKVPDLAPLSSACAYPGFPAAGNLRRWYFPARALGRKQYWGR